MTWGCARRVQRARIETLLRRRGGRRQGVAPAACSGRGLKRVFAAVPALDHRVAPAACSGRGLKPLKRPLPLSSGAVAPAACSGRGLKPHVPARHPARHRVAPAACSGRGLKRGVVRLDAEHHEVAPAACSGRGLKLVELAVAGGVLRGCARRVQRARIETRTSTRGCRDVWLRPPRAAGED